MGVNPKRLLEVGEVFERLTVKKILTYNSGRDARSKRIRYLCRCVCGKEVIIEGYRLVSKNSKSCGCLQRDKASQSGLKRIKHGYTCNGKKIPEYSVWTRMWARCTNENNSDYSRYGGRGIKVCDRWRSFALFLKDMGRRPGPKFLIDRRDNDGNYEPRNCRWVDIKESNRNRRNIRKLTIDGRTKGVGEWSEESGTNLNTILARLSRGWSPKDAVFESIRQEMLPSGNRWKKRK